MSKVIWITRAKEEIENSKKIVEKYGFKALCIPLIEFHPLKYNLPYQNFEGIVFSSKNAVRYFFKDQDLIEKLKACKIIFCVGKETKKLLENYMHEHKINKNIAPLPKKYQAEDLAKVILENNIKTVLAPGPKDRRKILFDILKNFGIHIYKLDIYETKIRKLTQTEKEKVLTCDAVSLTSPSTFKGILENDLLDPLLEKNTHFLVIGDVTERTVEKFVPKNLIIKPNTFTFENMIKSFKNFLGG